MPVTDYPEMECAKDYQAVISNDGQLAFVISVGITAPGKSPQIVYNGGSSALLYRSNGNVLVLDCLHPQAQQALAQARQAIIIETDRQTGYTVYDYIASIKNNKRD